MNRHARFIEHATIKFNRFLGTSMALAIACALLLLWAWARASDSKWHELIVEGAAMLGFINLFTLQRAQAKDLKAIHIKLDELIACTGNASNLLIKSEEAPEHILDAVHEVYREAAKAVKDEQPRAPISLEQADDLMKELHKELLESPAIDMSPAGDPD